MQRSGIGRPRRRRMRDRATQRERLRDSIRASEILGYRRFLMEGRKEIAEREDLGDGRGEGLFGWSEERNECRFGGIIVLGPDEDVLGREWGPPLALLV